jgi:vacuolar-type H+-ATPase catalytic subunit A/Vma1
MDIYLELYVLLRPKVLIMKINYNARFWKAKAAEKAAIIKSLGKRIKELITSRDMWKNKYVAEHKECEKYKKELAAIKKKIEKILN